MAYALISNTQANGAGSTTTSGITTTGANLIVISVSYDAASFTGPTDSNSNSYTHILTQSIGSGNWNLGLWYAYAPTVGAAHTFTASTTNPIISVSAYSGSTSNPLDRQNSNNNTSSATIQPGSVTPSQNNQLIVTATHGLQGSGGAPTVGSGFTTTNTLGTGAQGFGGMAYLIQTNSAAVNPTWTYGTASFVDAAIATFSPPSSASNWFMSPTFP